MTNVRHGSKPDAPSGFIKAPAVAEMCGLSYRMFDYFIDKGWVRPTIDSQGSGSARLFSDEDSRRCVLLFNRYHELSAALSLFKDRADNGFEWDATDGA